MVTKPIHYKREAHQRSVCNRYAKFSSEDWNKVNCYHCLNHQPLEDVCYFEEGINVDTIEVIPYCPSCNDGMPRTCELCGKKFKFEDRVVCNSYETGYDEKDSDCEHVHIECWYKRERSVGEKK